MFWRCGHTFDLPVLFPGGYSFHVGGVQFVDCGGVFVLPLCVRLVTDSIWLRCYGVVWLVFDDVLPVLVLFLRCVRWCGWFRWFSHWLWSGSIP